MYDTEREFELETILTITTGVNCTNDFDKIYQLFWFVFNDKFINATGICFLKDELKTHILNNYPDLVAVKIVSKGNLNSWLIEQKIKFGEKLLIPQINRTRDGFMRK